MSSQPGGRWPDFVGIGAIKCGTTWLHYCLCEHPQILMPKTKELQFFDERYALGEAWYRSFFPCNHDVVCGEISPQYMHDERVLSRIQDSLGSPRLIVCLRNPIERAYSHFMMDMRDVSVRAHAKADRFHAAVEEKDNKYVQFGFFYRQLLPFYEQFGRARIHVVLFDDIKNSPRDTLKSVFAFLGVDTEYVPGSMLSQINSAKRYRSLFAFKALQSAVRLTERLGGSKLVLHAKMGGLRDRVLSVLEVGDPYPAMQEASRSALANLYRKDVESLSRILGRDLTHWVTS